MVNVLLESKLVINDDTKVFGMFFFVNRESIDGYVYWRGWLFVALPEE